MRLRCPAANPQRFYRRSDVDDVISPSVRMILFWV
jgi:hypothetical protein